MSTLSVINPWYKTLYSIHFDTGNTDNPPKVTWWGYWKEHEGRLMSQVLIIIERYATKGKTYETIDKRVGVEIGKWWDLERLVEESTQFVYI